MNNINVRPFEQWKIALSLYSLCVSLCFCVEYTTCLFISYNHNAKLTIRKINIFFLFIINTAFIQ